MPTVTLARPAQSLPGMFAGPCRCRTRANSLAFLAARERVSQLYKCVDNPAARFYRSVVLRCVRTMSVARVAAALLGLFLSGVPRVVALQAPVELHRCHCRHHHAGEECECALCRRAALQAQASDPTAPPCHRAAAQKALSGGTRSGAAPCLEGTCSRRDQPSTPLAGIDVFCPAGDHALRLFWRPRDIRPPIPESECAEQREPATPPPRSL